MQLIHGNLIGRDTWPKNKRHYRNRFCSASKKLSNHESKKRSNHESKKRSNHESKKRSTKAKKTRART